MKADCQSAAEYWNGKEPDDNPYGSYFMLIAVVFDVSHAASPPRNASFTCLARHVKDAYGLERFARSRSA